MTTFEDRPLAFWGLIYWPYIIKVHLNNDHLSTMGTIVGYRRWSLFTGLTGLVFVYCSNAKTSLSICQVLWSIKHFLFLTHLQRNNRIDLFKRCNVIGAFSCQNKNISWLAKKFQLFSLSPLHKLVSYFDPVISNLSNQKDIFKRCLQCIVVP